jgi:protein CsiD
MTDRLPVSDIPGNARVRELRLRGADEFYARTAAFPWLYARRLAVQTGVRAEFERCFGADMAAALAAAVRDRRCGAVRVVGAGPGRSPEDAGRLALALGAVCGRVYAPLGNGTGIDRVYLAHPEPGADIAAAASPYLPAPLHTDEHGSDEVTEDYVALACAERTGCAGGESELLHVDDWEDRDGFLADAIGRAPLRMEFPPPAGHGAAAVVRERPVFRDGADGPFVTWSPWSMRPADDRQRGFVAGVKRSLAASARTVRFDLPPGDAFLFNNHVWFHGRKAFAPDPGLRRVLFAVRGTFG